MKKIIKKIYYIGGTIYRGMIGVSHNLFDKEEVLENTEKEIIGKSINNKNSH